MDVKWFKRCGLKVVKTEDFPVLLGKNPWGSCFSKIKEQLCRAKGVQARPK